MQRYILLFVLVIFSISLNGQNGNKVYDDVDDAFANPADVTRFYLDCSEGDDSAFFAGIANLPNLNSLTIVGYQGKSLPDELFSKQSLTSLSFTECDGPDFAKTFHRLAELKNLEQITIDECNLLTLPNEVSLLPSLNKLVITNCDNFNLETCIDVLAKCKALKYLGLPVNDLCELPDGIGKLNHLEILDISNNALMDLPESMVQLNELNTLYTTNNLFINPSDALSKVAPLQIRFISVDSALTDEEMQKLKALFPDAKIGFSSPGDSLSESPVNNDFQSVYGEFVSLEGKLQILSEAYLHYARLFAFSPGFDSLLFQERYADTRYAYTSLRSSAQTYAWNSLKLYIWEECNSELPKGTICFNFYKESGTPYNSDIISFYRELSAFRGMYWVLDESMSIRKFKRDFVRQRRARRNIGAGWNDIRIFYDDVSKIFTLEFKNAFGFMRIRAYPLLENLRKPEISRDEYLSRFLRYQRSLDSKRKRFDKKLVKNLQIFRRNMLKLRNSQWKSFSEVYFSDTEKKMSQNQWLEYYDRIIANEKDAFQGAAITESLLVRFLEINNYLNAGGTSMIGYDSASVSTQIDFVDELGNKCVVGRVFMLNTLQKLFSMGGGTLGYEAHTLVVGPSKNVVVIVFLRNGQIGIVSRSEYGTFVPGQNPIHKLRLKLFDGKLLTFGQLEAEAGL